MFQIEMTGDFKQFWYVYIFILSVSLKLTYYCDGLATHPAKKSHHAAMQGETG
jgi:hypothetical protein